MKILQNEITGTQTSFSTNFDGKLSFAYSLHKHKREWGLWRGHISCTIDLCTVAVVIKHTVITPTLIALLLSCLVLSLFFLHSTSLHCTQCPHPSPLRSCFQAQVCCRLLQISLQVKLGSSEVSQ